MNNFYVCIIQESRFKAYESSIINNFKTALSKYYCIQYDELGNIRVNIIIQEKKSNKSQKKHPRWLERGRVKTNTLSTERVFAMSYYNTNQNRIPMYCQNGRIVGWIENNILQKNANAKKHMLHQPLGWAWDKSILERAIEMGISETIIHEKSANLDYSAKINDFFTFGVHVNRGFGEQRCLPLKCWEIHESGKPADLQMAFSFLGQ